MSRRVLRSLALGFVTMLVLSFAALVAIGVQSLLP